MSARMLLLSMLALTLVSPGHAEERAKMSRAQMQQMYSDYLKAEGYKPELDQDGDVVFKREGKTFFIQVSDQDQNYFRLVLPNFWTIESPAERAKVMIAADKTNSLSKAAKVFTTANNNVWVSVEIFVNDPRDFKAIFPRAASALDNGYSNFITALRGQ